MATPPFPVDPPSHNMVEVSIFGPGVGECIVVHLGEDRWLVVDSCIGDDGDAVALEYLRAIGVSPANIIQVVATHWHDDHIRGLRSIVQASGAEFVCSVALGQREFHSLVAASLEVRRTTKSGSGIDEMTEILLYLKSGNRQPTWANGNQTLLRADKTLLTSLSPSAAAMSRSLLRFARMAPRPRAALKVVPPVSPNETSIVLHLQSGNAVMLLGADLENTGSRDSGWRAIIGSPVRPTAKASTYKVAHHGSTTGDNEEIWTTLLTPRPVAVLTPFTRSHLPRKSDVERLKGVAGRLLQTTHAEVRPIRRDASVERMIAQVAKRPPAPRRGRMGQVRLRLNRTTGDLVSCAPFGAAFEVPIGRNHA
jgi:beta-lactamase superfamily II metal-dependent hydrolase